MPDKITLNQYFFDVFEKYKKTYKEYMNYTDDEMPKDQSLLTAVLKSDMENMNKRMRKGA